MSKLNDLISKFREIARDTLRMGMISIARDRILEIQISIDSINKNILAATKKIAIVDFEAAKVDAADPRKDDILASLADDKKCYEASIKDSNDLLTQLAEKKTKVEEKIVSIENGEIKVDKDELASLTEKYVAEFGKEQARTAVVA